MMMKLHLVALLTCLVVVGGRKIVDLSHVLDKNAPQFSLRSFGITNLTYYNRDDTMARYVNKDTWIALGVIEFYEHTGTHIDAPYHFGNGRQKLHEIPAHRLVGPGVVIDVKAKVEKNIDYAVLVEDILDYEKEFGRIPPGAIVLLNSGWDRRYPDPKQVFGTNDITDFSSFRYPGYSLEACKFLYEERQSQSTENHRSEHNSQSRGQPQTFRGRIFSNLVKSIFRAGIYDLGWAYDSQWIGSTELKSNITLQISVLGADSVSIDSNQLSGMACHKYLQPLNVPLMEYVANLDSIPQNGTTIVLGVPKIRDASGAPTRVLAFVDEDGDDVMNSSANQIAGIGTILLIVLANFSKQ